MVGYVYAGELEVRPPGAPTIVPIPAVLSPSVVTRDFAISGLIAQGFALVLKV
jgi:hypothetical protein